MLNLRAKNKRQKEMRNKTLVMEIVRLYKARLSLCMYVDIYRLIDIPQWLVLSDTTSEVVFIYIRRSHFVELAFSCKKKLDSACFKFKY